MIDENAFGFLVSYFDIEDDEYAGERADFVARYAEFAALVHGHLSKNPPSERARALDLGHALYLEVLEEDGPAEPIAWLRNLQGVLAEGAFRSSGILTFGSTWVAPSQAFPERIACGTLELVRISRPSEPFRRALQAEAATHGDEDAGTEGWGPGLYLDVDAVEALGRRPKNEPTVLTCGAARFYRARA